ncbi:MAG: hypothetical protein KJ710_04265 [Candidatus Omnitrophica bacterium]|nr:hypothetical protein [Candidatus Omnitrophota bacterium]MBU1923456.1 hypothetical protein [Candidatus Omnitrophota bacterium]
MTIIKLFDFLFQAIPIVWVFSGIFSGKIQGLGFILPIMLGFLILPYQFISSIIIVRSQFLKHELSKTSLIRVILCISIVGLLLLMLVANYNCWSVRDILTFSNNEFTRLQNSYTIHKGEPYFTSWSLCELLANRNLIFVMQLIFLLYIVPLFFILTLVERFIDVTRQK